MVSLLFLLPLLAALAVEYLACRVPKKRFWRYLPPVLLVLVVLFILWRRNVGWGGGEPAPIETLLFFPGLSALGAVLGLFLGWRLYKRLWSPRVMGKGK